MQDLETKVPRIGEDQSGAALKVRLAVCGVFCPEAMGPSKPGLSFLFRWRPLLQGWRPSQVGWRPSLLGARSYYLLTLTSHGIFANWKQDTSCAVAARSTPCQKDPALELQPSQLRKV